VVISEKLPTIIFADGASSGNPGPGGYGAIIATPDGQVEELGGGDPATTNNRMELQAVIAGLRRVERVTGEIHVFTDSVYVIQGITQWIWAWRSRDWKTAEGKDVANADQWKELFVLVARRGKEGKVSWRYVRGHSGIPGNERVDQIAVAFTKSRRPALYRGPLLRYDVPIHDIPEDTSVPERSRSKEQKAKAPAYSYLSFVNGALARHSTWKECEGRVKGRPGAKFKRAMSASDEKKIVAEWGLDPAQLERLQGS
jgi:ribonuclease HI